MAGERKNKPKQVRSLSPEAGRHTGFPGNSSRILSDHAAELTNARKNFDLFFNTIDDLLFVLDPAGAIIHVNRAVCSRLGYSEDDLIGKSVLYVHPPQRRDEAASIVAAMLAGTARTCPVPLITKDGVEIPVETRVVPGEWNGKPALFGVTKDVSALKQSEEKFFRAFHSTQVLMAISTVADGRYVDVNEAYLMTLGFERQEVIGKTSADLNLFVDEQERADSIHMMATQGRIQEMEMRVRHKDGSIRHGLFSADLITVGKVDCLLTSMMDITERKRAEASLQKASDRLSLAARAGRVGIWDWDVVNNNLVWDDQMYRLYGITAKTFSGAYEAWTTGLHPDDRVQGDADIQRALNGEKEFNTEFRVRWPDGTIRTIHALALVHRDAAGRPVRMIGTNWDVTEQKQLENNVKSSEENFRTFFQTVDDMIVVATPEGRILFTNNAFNQKLGYTHEELKAMKVLDIHPAECREEAESILGAMLCGKRDFCPLPLQMKGGRRLPAETRVWLGKWNGEECIFGISKDLSEQQAALTTFEKVFHSNPALMAISSLPEKKFIDVNSSFLKRLGFTREEVIGKTVDELGLFVDPVSQATIATELERRGRVVGVDVSLRDKYGEMADGLFFGEIIDSHGKTVFLTVIADLTALKQAESALIHTERMSNLLMELAAQHINIPLAEVDAAIRLSLKKMGSFISADRAYVFRYDFFRKTTCNEYEWCHDDIAPQIEQLQDVPLEGIPDWVSAHENGRYLYIEDVKALPRGNLRDILEPQGIKSLITVPMMSNGVCIGFVGFDSVRRRHSYSTKEIALLTLFSQILVNVKSRARAQNDLVMTNQQLETATARADALAAQATQASTAKTTFLAHMSHEIRTPLNAILGFSQLLQYDPDLTLRQKQRVETINRSGEHLLALLNDILELSKIEAGGLTAVPTTFDLQSLLSDLAMVFRIRAEARNLTLQTDGLDGVPFFITTDEQKLRQVLINLLSNAVKYTRKGGIWLRLAIAQEGTDDLRLVIQVEDTGLGITAEEMGTLFMAFEQASAGRKSGTGTGLGLAISRQFARLMGGDVTVTSQTDKGSIFCLDIPVKSGNTSLRTNKIDMRQVLRLEADHPRYRILVVDDNDDSRHLLTQMLGNVGFEVLMASDGREALAVFTQQHPQLILMDDGMPVMCGDDSIRKIRQSPGGTDVRIMTLTANASDETRHRTIAAGADAFMAKPFRTTTLFENIHRLSGIRYVYDELETSTAASPEQARVMTQEMMTTLPIELRQQIRAATISGRHGQLLTLVQQVAAIKPEMGETLRNMVTAFDYERLIQLLN